MINQKLFKQYFKQNPQVTAEANGRINLIGEHTDYSGGYVLPTLIPHKTIVSIGLRDDNRIKGVSEIFGELECGINSSKDGTWLDFIRGAHYYINKNGANLDGINIAVTSNIPVDSGLSSSAALEISILRALTKLTNIEFSSLDLAKLGQKIEHNFVGTQCGIMDQIVCSCSKFGEILFLDCEELKTKILKGFKGYSFLIIHSGETRKLSMGKYNERKNEIENVIKLLKVKSLKEATINQVNEITDLVLRKRAHHVVSENNRVLQAFKCIEKDNPLKFGKLMYESHVSMSDDFEISSDKLNHIVKEAKNLGSIGARLTGAGFGGCVVVMSNSKNHDELANSIINKCPNSRLVATISSFG